MSSAAATARWELLRALGAAVLTPPPANQAVCAALGLPEQSAADHTAALVLGLPPFAAIYAGPEGKLGGEGLDRVAGFWRALGIRPPEDADHLGVLLMLYAELGQAEEAAGPGRCGRLAVARAALFDEHLWSWAPAYLTALADLGIESVAGWARLAAEALSHERSLVEAPDRLPLALRSAPDGPTASAADLLDAVVTPVRSGIIVAQRDLQRCAADLGVGFRRGERRFAAKALLEQEPAGAFGWLAEFARGWAVRHASLGDGPVADWWAGRAARFADVLDQVTPGRRLAAR